jgi:hypothetical protein
VARRLACILASVALVAVSGCSHGERLVLLPPTDSRSAHQIPVEKAMSIEGYTIINGSYHKFSGTVRATAPDSLTFYESANADRGVGDLSTSHRPRDVFTLARSDVAAVYQTRIDVDRTVLFGIAMVGIAFGLVALHALSSLDSY